MTIMTHWTRHLNSPTARSLVFAVPSGHRSIRNLIAKVSVSPAPSVNIRVAPSAIHAGRVTADSEPASSSGYAAPRSRGPGTALADPTRSIHILTNEAPIRRDPRTEGGDEKAVLPEEVTTNMSSTLLQVVRDHSSVIAVVGKGHLQGIKNHWQQPIELNHLKSLTITMRPLFSCPGHLLANVRVALFASHAALGAKTRTPNGKKGGKAWAKNKKDAKAAPGEEARVLLPQHLVKNVTILSCDSARHGASCNAYLVGVNHDTQESCREVQAVVSYLKPQAVFLELCSRREHLLKPQSSKVPTRFEMIKMWTNNQINTLHLLHMWSMAKRSSELGVSPGAEFRVACEEAMKYGGKVILGDRPSHITAQRAWVNTSLWHKATYMFPYFRRHEDLGEKKNKELNAKTSEEVHPIVEAIVHERDRYMSSKLLEVAREHKSVVAVVGKAHLPGIEKYWKQPIERNLLLETPQRPKNLAKQIFKFMGFLVASAIVTDMVIRYTYE